MTRTLARAAAVVLLTMLTAAPAAANPPTVDPASATIDGLGALVAGATGFQPPSSTMVECMTFHAALPCAQASQGRQSWPPAQPTLDELVTFLSGSVGL